MNQQRPNPQMNQSNPQMQPNPQRPNSQGQMTQQRPNQQTLQSNQTALSVVYPNSNTLLKLAKLGIINEKPIYFSFWLDSNEQNVSILNDTTENCEVLYKNDDEFTSPIKNKIKCEDSIIYETENSIYITNNMCKTIHKSLPTV